MQPARECDLHFERLRELLARFRAQERSLLSALELSQALLEHWQREASYRRTAGVDDAEMQRRLCIGLREECDALEIELAHVRMAILGVAEELALHGPRVGAMTVVVEHGGTWLLPA